MVVPQLVNLFEALERPSTPPQERGRKPSRIRLQLQTMFSSSRSRSAISPYTTPSSSVRSSPSPSYRYYQRRSQIPSTDLSSLFTAPSTASSPCSPSRSHKRRQLSAIDVVLEAERGSIGAENIGLGLFEPRPRAISAASSTGSSCSILEFMNESQPTPAVLDGIFEVMESA
jgi:hypothetical protein